MNQTSFLKTIQQKWFKKNINVTKFLKNVQKNSGVAAMRESERGMQDLWLLVGKKRRGGSGQWTERRMPILRMDQWEETALENNTSSHSLSLSFSLSLNCWENGETISKCGTTGFGVRYSFEDGRAFYRAKYVNE